MSLSALSSAASTALPVLNVHPHGHKRGAHVDQGSSTSSTSSSTSAAPIGQLPVGASTPLFDNLLQSLTQTLGAQTAAITAPAPAGSAAGASGAGGASGASGATSTAARAGSTPANVQAFMHVLFQTLKQDGLGAGAGSGTGASSGTVASGAGAAAGASGQYQATLMSSLHTLVQQVGTPGNAATANLSAAYQNLVSGAGSGTAAGSAASAGGLQSFLNHLLQNLQSDGVHSLSSVGNNVNANV
jgi:hypothetical protein